jgi:RNA polymerase sigma-70 factor (ECF subfamily)
MLRHKRDTVPIENLAVEMPENEERRQRMEELMTLMNSLPDRQQMILRLRHMEGMTIGEMAELFGTTENAMSKALSRARQAIRDRYTDKHK